ncbi:MAG: hypothetical protein BWX92_03602 [Deltaproteobacteria bacterium ADurb.Bin135]|nr:MAG: hypothetical protein BWX92_03602 [Deltaproteobacteria bacterium ADurb.Bin135]
MTSPKITNKQTEILTLIFQFRFLNRTQIQQLLNHKDPKTINTWLKDLTEKQFLNRIYENTIGANTKPAIYYAGINAIRYYKSLGQDNNPYLKKLYRDNERSQSFIDEQIFIADICLDFLEINAKGEINYTFETAAGVTSNPLYSFMEDLSPQLIFTKESKAEFKQYILVQLDSVSPKYMIKKRLKNYIEFFFTNEWEENTNKSFPTILFTCQTMTLMIYAKRTMKGLLNDYQEPEDFDAWFSTNDKIREQGISAEIWE